MKFSGKCSVLAALCAAALLTGGCESTTTPRPPAGPPQPSQSIRPIPASDRRFCYEGQIDFSDSNAPVIIWEATRVRLDFSGDMLKLLFADAHGQNYFDVEVDGSNTVVAVNEGMPMQPPMLSGFGPGRHQLILFKRSEATAGTVRFCGVELATDARAWAPKPVHYKLRMEFIGDSITVGACNEDGPADQWTNRLTHDSALSYAALTAAAFNADHRNISVSGMGVTVGFVPMLAGEIWDRLYPNTNSPRADLTRWVPQVVFVNFGENDCSFTRNHGQPFPKSFTDDYIALIHAIRDAYPRARIVLLRGGIKSGAESMAYRDGWDAAVNRLENADKNISHFGFAHSSQTHPRVADDRIMAEELITWLKHAKVSSFKAVSPRN